MSSNRASFLAEIKRRGRYSRLLLLGNNGNVFCALLLDRDVLFAESGLFDFIDRVHHVHGVGPGQTLLRLLVQVLALKHWLPILICRLLLLSVAEMSRLTVGSSPLFVASARVSDQEPLTLAPSLSHLFVKRAIVLVQGLPVGVSQTVLVRFSRRPVLCATERSATFAVGGRRILILTIDELELLADWQKDAVFVDRVTQVGNLAVVI